MQKHRSHPLRTLGLLAVVLALALSLVGAGTATSATATSDATKERDRLAATGDKLAPDLAKSLESQEPQPFWVQLGDRADTSAASGIDDWADRGRAVVDALQSTAKRSQAEVVSILEGAGVDYTAYWIVNAIRVERGDYLLARQLAADPSVERLFAPVAFEAPEPFERTVTGNRAGRNAAAQVEWGVSDVKADQVWEQYGVRGDGIVVANIDSGVQVDHPALDDAYRGYDSGTGRVDNDYSWLDVSGTSPYPSDGNGHGTHTMGTMVGDDGAANQVGVAPGARWVAANGCCPSDQALVDSAQWMLAPTKVDGSSPDPAKRPHVINNSWGTTVPSDDPFMEDVLTAWADAGIFGVWANGNLGEQGCQSSSAPGSRSLNYSVAAYDAAGEAAPFSSRGPGQDGEVKPNIAGPGVAVRSSLPGGRYGEFSGTSMATPHVAGAVALLWSADPDLIGDIAGTRQLLDDTATDRPDDQCGGTDDDNNVFGEGRLDALALVASTQDGPSSTVTGTVTHDATGDPVRGATIRLVQGSVIRSARTGDDGSYGLTLPVGDYEATVTAFGYEPATVAVSVVEGQPTVADVVLNAVEGFSVSGRVVDDRSGNGIPGARVTLTGTRHAVTTGDDGRFVVEQVPGPSSYLMSVDAGGCTRVAHRTVQLDGDLALPDVRLARLTDQPFAPGWGWDPPYGYSCVHEPTQWQTTTTQVATPDPFNGVQVPLPFAFTYFGQAYDKALVGRNGQMSFWPGKAADGNPNFLHWGLWPKFGGVSFDESTRLMTAGRGRAPDRSFTVEWRDVTSLTDPAVRYSFQVTLHEDGDVVFAYKDIDDDLLIEQGVISQVAIFAPGPDESLAYGHSFEYADEEPVLTSARQIRFTLPSRGSVEGRVLDDATGTPIEDADVDLVNPQGEGVRRVETDASGRYRLELMADRRYTIVVADAPGFQTPAPTAVELTGDREVRNMTHRLRSGRFRLTPDEVVLRTGRDGTVTVRNTGKAALQWRAEGPPAGERPEPGTQVAEATTGLGIQVGVEEVDGSWWVSAADYRREVPWVLAETTTGGQPTGRRVSPDAIAAHYGVSADRVVAGDLAWVPSRGWLCMLLAAGEGVDDIVCVDPDTSEVTATIDTGYGQDVLPQGLAYDPEDDLFFVMAGSTRGGHQRWHRTLAGVDHPALGKPVSSCRDAVSSSGLAWDPATRLLWTNGAGHVRQVDPATCTAASTVEATYTTQGTPFVAGDIDEDGDLLTTFGFTDIVGEIAVTDALPRRPSWLDVSAWRGSVDPNGSKRLTVAVDWAALPAGTRTTSLVLRGNGGRETKVVLPIRRR